MNFTGENIVFTKYCLDKAKKIVWGVFFNNNYDCVSIQLYHQSTFTQKYFYLDNITMTNDWFDNLLNNSLNKNTVLFEDVEEEPFYYSRLISYDKENNEISRTFK